LVCEGNRVAGLVVLEDSLKPHIRERLWRMCVRTVMDLHSATSAILSAVIINAVVIPVLIPIALKGVAYRPVQPTPCSGGTW
jgi:high-affinity K+ transport system ATPase subunit B